MKDPIDAFWAWWPTVSDRFARCFDSTDDTRAPPPDELLDALGARVAAIHESLEWEFGPGGNARHHLCLSGCGDPELRLFAERWLRRAPEADETWEFHAARQGSWEDGGSLQIDGRSFPFEDYVVAFERDDTREVLDIEVFHPALAALDDERERRKVVFLSLDAVLGEEGVERWIGTIDVIDEEPEGVSLGDLVEEVARLADDATGEQWVLGRGEIDGQPIFVSFNAALKPNPIFDQHVSLVIPLARPTEEGLTQDDEADALNEMEDALLDALGDQAVQLGRETHAGRRVVHFQVMEGGPAAGIVDAWRARYPAYPVEVRAERDLSWSKLGDWG